ncbi:MAG: DUF2283 domain-containing protein [Phototrophicaceae bacterium]|jgi:uncharacterized protein YuzE
MTIEYDPHADILYIQFSTKPFAKNRQINDMVIADLDSNGEIIRLELLDASHYVENAAEVTFRVLAESAIHPER